MMKIGYIPLWVILFLSGCSTDEMARDKEGQGNITLLLNAGSEITIRTALSGSESVQHVEKVFLYVFSGTDDAASYVQTQEIPWPAPGDVGYQTTSRTHLITLDPGAYTFLAIGLDDRSGTTYGLPQSIAAGSTLSGAKAILAGGKRRTDIAQSELFAGYAIAPDIKLKGNPVVTVNLVRRVSGVIGWFRNIPYKLPDQASGTEVRKMTIELYTNQNKVIALRKATANDYGETPFADQENAMDNRIVLEYDLTGFTQVATGQNYQDVTAVNANNTLLAGSFLLPAIAPPTPTATFTLRYYDDMGAEIAGTSRTIKLVSAPSGEAATGAGTQSFAIEANQLYSLGTKDAPIDLDPGIIDDIVISVTPWWEDPGGSIPVE